MEDEREKTAGDAARQAPASDLAERLARRGSESPGVVDVSGPRRHYTRTAGWVAQKFSLVNRVRDRYGVADARTAAQSSFVMRSSPHEAEDVDEIRRVSPSNVTPSGAAAPSTPPAAAPEHFAPPSAEQLAARAVMLSPQPGDSPASPTAPQGNYSEASSDARPDSPTPQSGVRVRRANVRSTMHAGPSVLARVAAPTRPANSTPSKAAPPADARGVSETAGAGRDGRLTAEPPRASSEASAATAPPSAAPVKAEPSPAPEGVADRPALLMRKAPAAALREGGEGVGAEPLQRTEAQPATAGAHEGASATASEVSGTAAAPGSGGDDGAAAISSPASHAPAAASRDAAPDGAAKAAGDLLMRSGDKGAPVRPRAEVEGRAGSGQLPLVKATAGPSLLRAKASAEAGNSTPPGEGGARPLPLAKSSAPDPVAPTSPGAAVGTASAHAGEDGTSGRGPASQSNVLNDGGGGASVAVAGITRGVATRAEAGMVWRRAAVASPERADTTSSTGGAARSLMRQDEGGPSTTTTQTAPDSAGPAAADGASAGGVDVGEITEQVIRAISRRMAVERERRGFRK